MKRLAAILVLGMMMMTSLSAAVPPSDDKKFEELAAQYIEQSLKLNPEGATILGDHRFDSQLTDRSAAAFKRILQYNRETLSKLNAFKPERLSAVNRVDYRILQASAEAAIFDIETIRDYEWNPLSYNIGGALFSLVARDFAPLKNRLQSVKERLKGIPTVVAQAKTNLKNPPKIYTETAISQNKGNIGLVKEELNEFLKDVPELKAEFAPLQEAAAKSLEEYGIWLEKDLLPRSNRDFRIGDANFRKKLRYSLESDLTKEEVLKRAETELVKTTDELYATALPLYKKFFPAVTEEAKLKDKKHVIKSVLDKLAETRPNNDTIVPMAQKSLANCTEFVRKNNLMTVPTEPLKIIVMPEFQRGFSVAYCESPGALEKNGETFYAISPTPKDWTAGRVESFFKEYNQYMVENLTVHEAMPGHYLQLVQSNKFTAPTKVRAIFQSGIFAEGWATYTEQLMVEKGYGGPEVKMQQLKMRLRLIINSIIDQKIHTAGMTEKEAMDLMMNQGFQEDGEAAGKWRRACLSSGQLSTYFVGNIEINEIRKAYEAKHGTGDMKKMHDTMMSFGTIAPKYVKELMGL
ncbi:MAG: DUF885 domain-containing protein [Blastocatellia bacterium]|nr:DUF885 domain-containing protein [Blastocatellia bacterium]